MRLLFSLTKILVRQAQYGTLWPTKLDKIKNLHSTDSIDTKT